MQKFSEGQSRISYLRLLPVLCFAIIAALSLPCLAEGSGGRHAAGAQPKAGLRRGLGQIQPLEQHGRRLSEATTLSRRAVADLAVNETVEILFRAGPINTTANAERLAMVVVVTNLREKASDRLEMLHINLRLAVKHLFPVTPCTVYIFTDGARLDYVRTTLQNVTSPPEPYLQDQYLTDGDAAPADTGSDQQLLTQQRRTAQEGSPGVIHVLPVPTRSWVLSEAANDSQYWHGHWGGDYRIMGDWRLQFMPHFARALGHRYVMQWDDDSYITGRPPYNLVQEMDRGQYLLAARRVVTEPPMVVWGLAELARYFLLTYRVQPTTLFQHCTPPDITGLYSATTGNVTEQQQHGKDHGSSANASSLDPHGLGQPLHGGWDRTVLNGNCVIISLDFWFQPLVQRFVQLCRSSGGSAQYRWNEQGVLGMVRHVFVPGERLLMLDFPYVHKGRPRDSLRAGGIYDVH